MRIEVRMASSGNGMPVFTIAERGSDMGRPFGATWDGVRGFWMYPAFFPVADKVLADFHVLERAHTVAFSEATKARIALLQATAQAYAERQLPEGFTYITPPYEHQVFGLCHAFYMPRSALFFDPGLGKSKIAIDYLRLLRHLGDKMMAVILGPLFTVRNWGKEIDKHSGGALRWGAVLGTVKQKMKVIDEAAEGKYDALLMTYDTTRNYVDKIVTKVPYGLVVADESQLIKDWRSARSKAAYMVAQKAGRRLLMTGTPTLGSPMDLYGQFKFLGDYFMPENWMQYRQRYFEVAPHNKHLVLGYKNLDILNARTTFISVRRTKAECLDLPPQVVVDVDVTLSREQTAVYNQLIAEMGLSKEVLADYLSRAADGDASATAYLALPHVATLLIKLLQVSAGFLITPTADLALCDHPTSEEPCPRMFECVASSIKPYTPRCVVVQERPPDDVRLFDENAKLDALTELLDSILGNPEDKVIIWCYFIAEMDLVSAMLEKKGIGYVRVDGRAGAGVQSLVDRFNEDPSIRVYLGQVSTGVGITLNAANYTIYASLTFSLGSYHQSMDRNYRIGQERKVTVYRLLGVGTIEPFMIRLLKNKVDVDTALTIPGAAVSRISRVVTRPRQIDKEATAAPRRKAVIDVESLNETEDAT